MRPQPFAPSERVGLHERLGRAYGLVGDLTRSRGAYEEMLAETRETGDREAEWRALLHLAVLGTDHSVRPEEDDEFFRGLRRKTGEGGENSEKVGEDENGPASPVFWSPSYALGRAEEALALAQGLGRDDFVANSLFLLALLGAWAGRWDGVADRTAEARSLFVAAGDRAMEAEVLTLSAWSAVVLGRPQEALRFGRDRLAATRELGDQDIHLADSHGLVVALLEVGEYEQALSVARRAVEERGEVALQLSEPLHRRDEIEALLRGGDRDLARRETERFGERVGGSRRLRVSHLCALAVLAKWGGDLSGAAEHLLAAESLSGEIGLPGELWRAGAGLGGIHEACGSPEEAGRAFAGAAGILRGLAGRIGDEGLRAGFLAAPQVGWVLERTVPAVGRGTPDGGCSG